MGHLLFLLQKAAFHQNMDPPDMDMQAIYERLENIQPENIDITAHFTAEELKNMPDIEQNRYKSIKLNYMVMLEFGKCWRQTIDSLKSFR